MTIKELCDRVWAGRFSLAVDAIPLAEIKVAVGHRDSLDLEADWQRIFGGEPYRVTSTEDGSLKATVFGMPVVVDTRLNRGEIRFQWERSV